MRVYLLSLGLVCSRHFYSMKLLWEEIFILSIQNSFSYFSILRLSAFTLVAVYAIAIEAEAISNERKHNCMIKHLKTLHMLESDFPIFPGGVPDNCEEIIKDFSEKSYQDVIKAKKAESMKKCVDSYLRRHKYPENLMKDSVIVASLSISPKLKPFISRKLQGEDHDLVIRAIGLCQVHKKFAETFDNVMDAPRDSTAEDENPVPFYCARKHVVDNNEIDNKVYHIEMNPKNIDTKTAHCTEFYESYKILVKATIEEVIERHIKNSEYLRDCIRNKMFETQFIDEVLILEVLSEIKLTAAQRETEKQKFLVENDKVMESVLECVWSDTLKPKGLHT